MHDLESLLKVIERHPGSHFVGPQPEARIEAAESRLGVRFPPSYRAFLLAFGAGSLGSEEIYGVFRDDFDQSGVPDAVWVTLDRRRELDLDPAGVVIGYDGSEGILVLDVGRRRADGTAPVVWWSPDEILEAAPVIAPDFAEYLAQLAASSDGNGRSKLAT